MELAKAIAWLFPDAEPFVDYELRDIGQGPYIAVWHIDAPQPTPAQIAEAAAAYDAAEAAERAADSTLRQQIINLAQSAVGQPLNTLTAAQVRALLAVLLWRAGALTNAGAVRPLGEWADRA